MAQDTLKKVAGVFAGIAGIGLMAVMVSQVSAPESTEDLVARLRKQRRSNPRSAAFRKAAHR